MLHVSGSIKPESIRLATCKQHKSAAELHPKRMVASIVQHEGNAMLPNQAVAGTGRIKMPRKPVSQ